MKRVARWLAVVLTVVSAVAPMSVSAYGEHWIDTMAEPSNYAYSLMVVGDTQVVCDKSPEGFKTIYDWILANYKAKKTKMVIGLGDITEHHDPADVNEWNLAYENISRLFGKVPVSLIRGNHDDKMLYNGTLYDMWEYVDGAFDSADMCNTYQLLTVGNIHYLVLALDYGPSDEVLDWANKVCKAHPGYNVIVTTHGYMDTSGTLLKKGQKNVDDGGMAYHGGENGGEEIWSKLVSKNRNIVMVLCGHVGENGVVRRTRQRSGGMRPVVEMLINPQSIDEQHKLTGMVAMLYFSADGKTVTVQNYSTIQKKFYGEQQTATLDVIEHTHKTLDATAYTYDETHHWTTCPCGAPADKTAHKFVSGKCVCGMVEGQVVTTTTTTVGGGATSTTAASAAANTSDEDGETAPLDTTLLIVIIAAGVLVIGGMVTVIIVIAKKK